MTPTPELTDVFVFVGKALALSRDAKSDDGKVSMPETLGIISKLLPSGAAAINGVSSIKQEFLTITDGQLKEVYYAFCSAMEWQPDDTTRDKFDIVSDVVAAIVEGASKWKNTISPPRALVVKE